MAIGDYQNYYSYQQMPDIYYATNSIMYEPTGIFLTWSDNNKYLIASNKEEFETLLKNLYREGKNLGFIT